MLAVLLLATLPLSACRSNLSSKERASLAQAARSEAEQAWARLEGAAAYEELGKLEQAERARAAGLSQLETARARLDRLLSDEPAHGKVLEARGYVAEVEGRQFLAADLYLRARLAGEAGEQLEEGSRRVARSLHRHASAVLGDSDPERILTIERYKKVIRALTGGMPPSAIFEPIRERVLIILCEHAANLVLAGRLDEAREAYNAILELEPRLARAYVGLGQLARRELAREESFRQFRRALQLEPESVAALAAMFNMMLEEGREDEARRYLERIKAAQLEEQPAGGVDDP